MPRCLSAPVCVLIIEALAPGSELDLRFDLIVSNPPYVPRGELDTLSPEDEKRYMHRYNFPPFSVGEVKPMRGPGRREISEGRWRAAVACWRALRQRSNR